MITRLILLRHAQADALVRDAQKRPLTAEGERSARLLDAHFQKTRIDAVYSSPFLRAVSTVRPLAASRGLTINTDDRLREWNGGRPFPEAEFFPRVERMFAAPQRAEGGAETMSALKKRMLAAVMHIVTVNRGQTALVCSHALAISAVLNHYDPAFGYQEAREMLAHAPWIADVQFDEFGVSAVDCRDPFALAAPPDDIRFTEIRPFGALGAYKYAIIFARAGEKWVFCRAKARDCYETPGGHIENGETPAQAAARELYEETGARDFTLRPLFDCSVRRRASWANGQVFYAEISAFDPLPPFEMAEIRLFDALPEALRFPDMYPELFHEVLKQIR